MQPQVSDQPDALADKIEEQFASLCDSDCGKVLRDNIYIYNIVYYLLVYLLHIN